MQLKLGDPVRSLDGKDIGKIRHLIMDPAHAEVKTLVVEKGWFLPEDIELPIEAVQEAGNRGIQVAYTVEQMKNLPHFDEHRYTSAPPEGFRSFQAFPFGGLLWPNGFGIPMIIPAGFSRPAPSPEEEQASPPPEKEAPLLEEHDTVISVGDEVISHDGEKIGEVHSVTLDSDTRRPTRLVIRRGWLFHADREISADAIDTADNGVVYLNLNKSQINTAP